MNAIDDDLIRRLRDELDSLTAYVSVEPPDLDVVGTMTLTSGRHAANRRAVVLVAAATALVIGIVGLVTTRADRDASGGRDSSPATAPPATTASTVAVVLPVATATPTNQIDTVQTAALQDIPYFAVGESVMLGAKPVMEARGITTVAEVSKSASWEIEQLRTAKSRYNITNGVVIQLGTNGPVTREQYEAVLAELPPAEFPLVVVMTVKADKPWITRNNEIIRSLPDTHPNVEVLDWEARSAEIASHLSKGDSGVHLADDVAKTFFRDVVLEALGIPTG